MTDNRELNGVFAVLKPRDWTSFDVVAKLRGILHTRKIGHGGTLDPMAEGVLPILVGRAAKACDIMPDTRKAYVAGFRLGLTTDTEDITGTVLTETPGEVSPEDLKREAAKLTGTIMQAPPMYSAVKVNGQRLYELARQGKTVEREKRPVTVHSLEVTEYDPSTRSGTLTISCGKGTYVRTLISDLGAALGVGGTMTSLTRTYSGGFSLEDCLTLEQLKDRDPDTFLVPVERVFRTLPELTLIPELEKLYRNGVKLRPDQVGMEPADGYFRVMGEKGFIGLGWFRDGMFRTYKYF